MADCFICTTQLTEQTTLAGMMVNYCPRCGVWQVLPGKKADSTLKQILEAGPNTLLRRSNLSHIVRNQQHPSKFVGVPLDDLEQWGLDAPLASPPQLTNRLITWIGQNQPSQSQPALVALDALAGLLGVAITPEKPNRDLTWLLNQPTVLSMAEQVNRSSPQLELRLTWDGWARYEELQQNDSEGNFAFMAMKFGDDELNSKFLTCFKPAVAETGFELRVLTDGQGAGCIDDQLRVALRTSRFVLADLTHGNQGAYWEAGYAEGLGKPVIYTCRRAEWEEQRTHFDTNHLVTIIWDPEKPEVAATALKAVIRATLPKDARLTDG